MLKPLFVITILFPLLLPVYADDAVKLYNLGVESAISNKQEFAFMYFDMIAKNYPKSRLHQDALFAQGEYYAAVGMELLAKETFRELVNKYPNSPAKVFALLYLFNMAKVGEEKVELKKAILSYKQLSLIFRDFKECRYKSANQKDYKARYFIDKVEIYIDEKLSAQIPF